MYWHSQSFTYASLLNAPCHLGTVAQLLRSLRQVIVVTSRNTHTQWCATETTPKDLFLRLHPNKSIATPGYEDENDMLLYREWKKVGFIFHLRSIVFLILSTRSRSKLQCVFLTTSQSSQPWLYVVKIKDLAKNSFLTHPSVWENFDPLDKHDESCLQHSLVGFGQEFLLTVFIFWLAWQIVNMPVCKFVRMIDWLTQTNTYTHIRTIVHAISTSIRSTKT